MDQKEVYAEILDLIIRFYRKAVNDFLIGYHFRNIHDFEEHIPRIADFWELQMTGNLTNKSSLPFNLIAVHAPLLIKKGEMGRWVVLFNEALDEKELKYIPKEKWNEKIDLFKERLIKGLKLQTQN